MAKKPFEKVFEEEYEKKKKEAERLHALMKNPSIDPQWVNEILNSEKRLFFLLIDDVDVEKIGVEHHCKKCHTKVSEKGIYWCDTCDKEISLEKTETVYKCSVCGSEELATPRINASIKQCKKCRTFLI